MKKIKLGEDYKTTMSNNNKIIMNLMDKEMIMMMVTIVMIVMSVMKVKAKMAKAKMIKVKIMMTVMKVKAKMAKAKMAKAKVIKKNKKSQEYIIVNILVTGYSLYWIKKMILYNH